MAIEYPSALRNPGPTPTSITTPTEVTIEPLVISSPFAHRLRLDFPSDDYVLGLYAILANPRSLLCFTYTVLPPVFTLPLS